MTYEQQIDKLTNEKNLIVEDVDQALAALRDIGHFALISGHKWPLCNPMTRVYEDDTRFEGMPALYSFDEGRLWALMGFPPNWKCMTCYKLVIAARSCVFACLVLDSGLYAYSDEHAYLMPPNIDSLFGCVARVDELVGVAERSTWDGSLRVAAVAPYGSDADGEVLALAVAACWMIRQ